MEETNKSAAAAEGDDTDQKLPAEPKSSSKGSAREKSELYAKRKASRSRSPVPGAQSSSKGSAREKSELYAKRKANRSKSPVPGAQSSSKGSAREKSELYAKRKASRSRSPVPGAQALTEAGERRLREKSDRNTKRGAIASRSATTTPGAYSATVSSHGSNSKGRKDRRGDKASGSRPLRPEERDEKAAAARRQRQGKPAVPGAYTALPSAARRKQDRLAARESPSARRKQSKPAANASNAVNEEEKSEDIQVDPVTVALAVVVNEEVGTENQKLKMMERERIENGEEKEILRRQMEDAMIRTEEKKRRNKRCMYIFIFFVVAIIAGVGAYFGTRGSSTDNAEGEATPSADQGDSPTAATSFNPTTPAPTSAAPTSGLLFNPPSEEDCAAIANGDALTNQEGGIVNEFNLPVDVTFLPTSDTDMNDALMDELMNAIQQYLMPLLVGCVVEDSRRLDAPVIRGSRKLDSSLRYVILNAITNGEYLAEESCEEDVEAPCYRVSVNLQLFLKEETSFFTLINFIAADFDGSARPLVDRLGLADPFKTIELVGVSSLTPTEAPTSQPSSLPSVSPTMNPTASPTTPPPTATPSASPTRQPVVAPTTESPTTSPTKAPTLSPTPPPTPDPTAAPVVETTPPPTPSPTRDPTLTPTRAPTPSPTPLPTPPPTRAPTPLPTRVPTRVPTPLPTPDPTPLPTRDPTPPPTSRCSMLEAILVDHDPLHVDAKNWLCDVDTWIPLANDFDPDRLWNERYAMAVLYYSTNGNGWRTVNGWLSSNSVCDWSGTFDFDNNCGGSDSRVTGIFLCESCLSLFRESCSSLFPPVPQLQQVCHLT
jgi:hypothetical protein